MTSHVTLQRRPEGLESDIFGRDEDGHDVFVPGGTAGFARSCYIVPDLEVANRVLRDWRRARFWLLFLIVAVLGGFGLAAYLQPGSSSFDVGLASGLACAGFLVLNWTVGRAIATRHRLEKSPRAWHRTPFSEQIGPRWVLAAVAAGSLVVLASVIWIMAPAIASGETQFAVFVLLLGVCGLATLPIGLAARKARRLAEDNARLESIVEERTRELAELNRTLEDKVREQVQHIEKLGQLKHFFAAPVAEMILNDKGFDPARVHRRELTAVSVDLRGFTAFSETSEPEEVISVLRIYHAELGIHVNRCQATLEHFAGDGVMLFLNDPIEVKDHPLRALELAIGLREAMQPHLKEWRSNGFDLGLGIGIATGYATIGAVGYEGRWEYAAIGTVCNLAARLCSEAKDGQIVISKRFLSRLGDRADCDELGERPLKGLSRPVAMFNVRALKAPEPATA